MKLTKERLRKIIREEVLLLEMFDEPLDDPPEEEGVDPFDDPPGGEGRASGASPKKLKDFIKPEHQRMFSTIPAGSLGSVLAANPEIRSAATNAANPQGQAQAFKKIAQLMDQEKGVRMQLKHMGMEGASIQDVMDVAGFLRYAEGQGMLNR